MPDLTNTDEDGDTDLTNTDEDGDSRWYPMHLDDTNLADLTVNPYKVAVIDTQLGGIFAYVQNAAQAGALTDVLMLAVEIVQDKNSGKGDILAAIDSLEVALGRIASE
jgi:hypothetical protein